MTPIKYGTTNAVFGAGQSEYLPLPARMTDDGEVVTCWRLSFRERLSTFFRGKIFVSVSTFNRPLQPIWIGTEDPIITQEGDNADES